MEIPYKVRQFRNIEEICTCCPGLLIAQIAQTVKFMFSNVFYRATVYKTGGPTAVKCIGPILKMVLYPIATINLNPIFHLFFAGLL